MSDARRAQLLLAFGLVLLVGAGLVATALLSRPSEPAAPRIETLDEAVVLGVVDQQVLDDLRAHGRTDALVHLDTAPIVARLQREIGADRTAQLIARMEAAFKANKQALLAGLGDSARIVRDFASLGAAVVSFSSEDAILAVARSPLVRRIGADAQVELPPDVETPDASPAAEAPMDADGSGVAVAVLDTGVDVNLYPGKLDGTRIAGTRELAPDDGSPDDFGHGTRVTSVVLSMAPQAQVYVGDVFRKVEIEGKQTVRARDQDILDGMQWVIDLRKGGTPLRAANLSLGSGHHPPAICDDGYHFIEALAAGVIPVVSSGNDAFRDDQHHDTPGVYHPGMGHPACSQGALSVGAVTYGHCADGSTDKVADFSQSSELLDMLAPGKCVATAGGPRDGTSYAAPMVTGAVAVLASAAGGATNDAITSALTQSGPLITDPNSGIIRHRLDVQAALQSLVGGASLPQPTPVRAALDTVVITKDSITSASPVAAGGEGTLDRFGVLNQGPGSAELQFAVGPTTSVFETSAPATWFSFRPDPLALDAGAWKLVVTTVDVPADAEPGTYGAVLRPRDAATGLPSLTGPSVRVSFKVAARDPVAAVGDTVDDFGGLIVVVLVVVGFVALWAWSRRRSQRRSS